MYSVCKTININFLLGPTFVLSTTHFLTACGGPMLSEMLISVKCGGWGSMLRYLPQLPLHLRWACRHSRLSCGSWRIELRSHTGLLISLPKSGVVVHTFNPSIWESEASGSLRTYGVSSRTTRSTQRNLILKIKKKKITFPSDFSHFPLNLNLP